MRPGECKEVSTSIQPLIYMFCRHWVGCQQFWLFWPKPALPRVSPDTPCLHFNPSVPYPNRITSTSKWACLHFISQNWASIASFLVFGPNQPPLHLTRLCTLTTSTPAYPTPMEFPVLNLSEPVKNGGSRRIIWWGGVLTPLFYFILYINFNTHIYYTFGFSLQCEWFTAVSVHHSVRAKTMGQTCTCTTCTCDRYSVTGGGYGVIQSHLQCDPCYTLICTAF